MDLSSEFVGHVEEHFPRGFFVRLMEEFELDYSDALDSCLRRFDREEAMDLLPYERRARNETSLRAVAREIRTLPGALLAPLVHGHSPRVPARCSGNAPRPEASGTSYVGQRN